MNTDVMRDLERQAWRRRLLWAALWVALLILVLLAWRSCDTPQVADEKQAGGSLAVVDQAQTLVVQAQPETVRRPQLPRLDAPAPGWGPSLGHLLAAHADKAASCFGGIRAPLRVLWQFSFQPSSGETQRHEFVPAEGETQTIPTYVRDCLSLTLAKNYRLPHKSRDESWHAVHYTINHGS